MPVKLEVIGIATKDMARSLAFYHLLGLDIPEGQEAESHVEAKSEGVRVAWDTIEILKDVYDGWVDQPVGHRIELAFRCDSPAAVDALYARLEEHGYPGHKPPWDAFWGQRYAIAKDPDGNLLSLFADATAG